MAALDKNLIPKLDQSAESARRQHFEAPDLESAINEHDEARAALTASSERKYPYRKTAAVIGAVLLSPILVRAYIDSQHYGYHPAGGPNTPGHINSNP